MTCKYIVVFLLFVSFSAICRSGGHDVDGYIKIIKVGTSDQKIKLYKTLYQYSGVTNEKLFDLLELNIRETNLKELTRSSEFKELYWSLDALASSGNNKYLQVLFDLEKKAIRSNTKSHARKAKVKLLKFSRWNPVLSGDEYETDSRSGEGAVWMRLLLLGDLDMAVFSVKKSASSSYYDDREFVEAVANKLESLYLEPTREKNSLNFQTHACKYLSMDVELGKHRSLLSEIAEKSPNRNVRKWAVRSLSI